MPRVGSLWVKFVPICLSTCDATMQERAYDQMAKCLLLKIGKLFAHKLDFRNWWISCLNSQAYGLAFCLSFAFSPLPKNHQIWYLSVASSSSWASFLQAILSRAERGELVFPPLRSQRGVWQPQRESSGKSFSQVLQQFYWARGERKAQSVHHCQIGTGCWWSWYSDANQAFHFQECSTFHLYL